MTQTSNGQVVDAAARVYEEFFVPALFAEWAPRVAAVLDPGRGDACLDVGCGTGVLSRELALRAGPSAVCGLDCNDGMLAVAAERLPEARWVSGRGEELPFEAGAFACVGSQFALMFMADRRRALQEMWRVLQPGGRLVVAVWASLEATPGYAALVQLLRRLFGVGVADELRAPFCLGEVDALRAEFVAAGLPGVDIRTVVGRAVFPSIEQWMHTDVKGWTLADKLDDEQYQVLLRAAETELQGFVLDGRVEFDSPALIAQLTKAA